MPLAVRARQTKDLSGRTQSHGELDGVIQIPADADVAIEALEDDGFETGVQKHRANYVGVSHRERAGATVEPSIACAPIARLRLGGTHEVLCAVDTNRLPPGADASGDAQRHVAEAASHVEHPVSDGDREPVESSYFIPPPRTAGRRATTSSRCRQPSSACRLASFACCRSQSMLSPGADTPTHPDTTPKGGSMHLGSRPTIRLATLATAALLAVACAQTPKPVTVTDTISATAVVESIDRAARTATLRTADGRVLVVRAGPDVRNFDQVKAGDRLRVSFTDALAAEVIKPGTGVTSVTPSVSRAAAGAMPSGSLSLATQGVVKVQSVDTANNRVTVTGADGVPVTLNVRDTQAQQFIRGLKTGDEVQLTYTESVAVSVEPVR